MSVLENLISAALAAPKEKQEHALRVLRAEDIGGPCMEPFLTLRETARQLGVSACTLWRWKVPGHEIGGRRRFRMSEVVAYIEAKAASSPLSPADDRQADSTNKK